MASNDLKFMRESLLNLASLTQALSRNILRFSKQTKETAKAVNILSVGLFFNSVAIIVLTLVVVIDG